MTVTSRLKRAYQFLNTEKLILAPYLILGFAMNLLSRAFPELQSATPDIELFIKIYAVIWITELIAKSIGICLTDALANARTPSFGEAVKKSLLKLPIMIVISLLHLAAVTGVITGILPFLSGVPEILMPILYTLVLAGIMVIIIALQFIQVLLLTESAGPIKTIIHAYRLLKQGRAVSWFMLVFLSLMLLVGFGTQLAMAIPLVGESIIQPLLIGVLGSYLTVFLTLTVRSLRHRTPSGTLPPTVV